MIAMKHLVIFLMPLAILLIIFQIVVFDKPWYFAEFKKLGVYETVGEDRAQEEANNILNYLRGREGLDEKFYTPRELLHLSDVKNLFGITKIFSILVFIIFSLSALYRVLRFRAGEFIKIIFLSSIASLAMYIFFIIASIFFFDKIFYLSHKILFANDFWLLDPEKELLVVIFPEKLFFDLAWRVIAWSILFSCGILLASALFLYKNKKTPLS